jgi:hypothetical protein
MKQREQVKEFRWFNGKWIIYYGLFGCFDLKNLLQLKEMFY